MLFGTWKGRKESQDALSNNLWRLFPFSTRSALNLSDHQKKRLLYPILFVIAQHWYLKLFQYSILRLKLPGFLDDFLWLLMSFRFLNHYLFFLCDFCWFFTFLFPDLWAPRPRGYFPQKNLSKTHDHDHHHHHHYYHHDEKQEDPSEALVQPKALRPAVFSKVTINFQFLGNRSKVSEMRDKDCRQKNENESLRIVKKSPK